MKTILLSTTSLWNCGDDFIRNGTLNLLNLKPQVRTIWWNRAKGVKGSFANDLKLNITLCDYFIIAGTPTWIDKYDYIYKYCLRKGISVALIGVGTKGGIWNFQQKQLMKKLASSGLVEICMARDEIAHKLLLEFGFKNAKSILDPAFFSTPLDNPSKINILGWRDYQVPEKMALKSKVKRVAQYPFGYYRKNKIFADWYNQSMKDLFEKLPNPKLVTVHDNREIKMAEKLFGSDHVFYSTDYRELFRIYSFAKSYNGSRIHGSISAMIHGANTNLLYVSKKAKAIENAVKILSRYFEGINNYLRVYYIKRDTPRPLKTFTNQTIDRRLLHKALYAEKKKIQEIIKQTKILSSYVR